MRQRGFRRGLISDAMVDFVRDQAHAFLAAPVDNLWPDLRGHHGPGRIRGTGDDQPVDPAGGLEKRHVRLEPGLRACREPHNFDAQGLKDVTVSRVAGLDDRDPITWIERSEERQTESARRSCRDNDLIHCHIHAIPVAIMACNSLAKFGNPK